MNSKVLAIFSCLLNLTIISDVLAKEFILKESQTENDAPPKRNETVRMIILGDSLTATLGWTTRLS